MPIKPLVDALDFNYLVNTLQELAKVPAAVPMGTEVFMEPDDPVLVRYVQEEIKPRLTAIGDVNLVNVPHNQIVVNVGDGGRGQIHALTAASLMYAATTLNRVLDEALQIHGGAGYVWESEINRLYRANKLLEIGAGTTEVRKMIISGEVLRA